MMLCTLAHIIDKKNKKEQLIFKQDILKQMELCVFIT